jgi:hypothetical protein
VNPDRIINVEKDFLIKWVIYLNDLTINIPILESDIILKPQILPLLWE